MAPDASAPVEGEPNTRNIVIVGGGASGSLVALGLLKRLHEGDHVYVIEPSGQLARGAAYGTQDPCHLLNVRAWDMSAYPDDASHFVRWLIDLGYSSDEASIMFASRKLYAQYLTACLDEQIDSSNAGLEVICDSATEIGDAEKLSVKTACGRTIEADQVVMALGNLRPATPACLRPIVGDPRYIANPWMPNVFARVGTTDEVFLLGTGLTMVDAVLSLKALGHKGKIIARSRHGFLPHTHRIGPVQKIDLEEVRRPDYHSIVIRRARAAGSGWREVIDGVRPHVRAVWESLSWSEKSRFLRRLRAFWEVHRHRVPEEAAAILKALTDEGQLSIGTGTILGVDASGDRLKLTLSGAADATVEVDWLINCTGPETDWSKAQSPVLESLVGNGLAKYDPLGLGLLVDSEGRTDSSGRVWALGSLCRGCWWETTSIPYIRQQAQTIAERLAHD